MIHHPCEFFQIISSNSCLIIITNTLFCIVHSGMICLLRHRNIVPLAKKKKIFRVFPYRNDIRYARKPFSANRTHFFLRTSNSIGKSQWININRTFLNGRMTNLEDNKAKAKNEWTNIFKSIRGACGSTYIYIFARKILPLSAKRRRLDVARGCCLMVRACEACRLWNVLSLLRWPRQRRCTSIYWCWICALVWTGWLAASLLTSPRRYCKYFIYIHTELQQWELWINEFSRIKWNPIDIFIFFAVCCAIEG